MGYNTSEPQSVTPGPFLGGMLSLDPSSSHTLTSTAKGELCRRALPSTLTPQSDPIEAGKVQET